MGDRTLPSESRFSTVSFVIVIAVLTTQIVHVHFRPSFGDSPSNFFLSGPEVLLQIFISLITDTKYFQNGFIQAKNDLSALFAYRALSASVLMSQSIMILARVWWIETSHRAQGSSSMPLGAHITRLRPI